MTTEKTELKLEDTLFVNDLYPYKGQKELSIAFQPMQLVSSSKLREYLTTRDYITKEQVELLDYMIGDSASISDRLGHEGEVEDEDFEVNTNDFHIPGNLTINISANGKDENLRNIHWLPFKFNNTPNMNLFMNFVFYDDGIFYGIRSTTFLNTIKAIAFDREKHMVNKEDYSRLCKELNEGGDGYCIAGTDLLTTLNFKCDKLSLTKVLISLLQDVKMDKIGLLHDFILTEMLSSRSQVELTENVFEFKGDFITYFYNVKNYLYPQDGTLGNSCMRGDSNTEQIRFYANNPSNVALLAYVDNKKLTARAVLWTSTDGKKFIDRLYCSSSKFATKLAAYCKSMGYHTIHQNTAIEYNIKYDQTCVVALDSFELSHNNYPYLDSMHFIDVTNKLVAPTNEVLVDYLKKNEYTTWLINHINRCGEDDYDSENYIKFHHNKSSKLKYLQDSQGNDVRNKLYNYAIIQKPKLSVVNRNDILTLNGNEKVDANWCENTLIKKYNSIRPTMCFDGREYSVGYFDKQFVVYSGYHHFYILKEEATYVPALNTPVLKQIIRTKEFQQHLRISKLRKMYGSKLVKITAEGLSELKDQVDQLPFKESLMDLRKSRVYNVSITNILWNGVRIKGVIIPYKHLRFVRK